jgi:hypothetical protein
MGTMFEIVDTRLWVSGCLRFMSNDMSLGFNGELWVIIDD